MQKFLIDEPLAQAILDYLKTRPYVEVYKLIEGLQLLPVIDTEPEFDETDEGSSGV